MAALKRSIARLEHSTHDDSGPGSPPSASKGSSEGAGGQAAEAAQAPQGEAEEADPEVVVTQADFLAAADSLHPSLSVEEVARYERIRDQYQQQAGQQR